MNREHLLKKKFVDLYQIAANPDNPKEISLTDEQIQSYKEFGVKDPLTIRPISDEDFDLDPETWQYVIVDGDHRLQFLIENPPEDTMLTVGSQVIIEDITRLLAFDITVQMNETRYTYGPKEYCKIIERYRSIDKKISGREISRRTGIPQTTIARYVKFLKEATQKEKEAVFSGELPIRNWGLPTSGQDEVTHVGHSEAAPKPEIQLFLKEDQYDNFSFQFDELGYSEERQPNGDRYIIFDNPSEYGKFTTAAQAFISKDDLKFIEDEFPETFTIVSQFKDSDMVGIFWLDLDSRKEFEESKIELDSKIYILNHEDYDYLFSNFEKDFDKREERSSGDFTFVKVVWTNTDSEKAFQEYCDQRKEDEKQKQAAATVEVVESQEIDLETFNKSIIPTMDFELIRKVWGYNVSNFDSNAKAPEGFRAIIWTDLKKKAEYELWTEEDRRNLISEHFKDDLTVTIPTEIFNQYIKEIGWTGIIKHEEDAAIPHVHVLLRSTTYKRNFEQYLDEISSSSNLMYSVNWHSIKDDIKKEYQGKMIILNPYSYSYMNRLLLFYSEKDKQAFCEAIDEESKPFENLSKDELSAVQKHLSYFMAKIKLKEYKDANLPKNKRLICEDTNTLEAIQDFLRPSRRGDYHSSLDFSEVPESDWIENKANAVAISFKFFKKNFEEDLYKWLEKAITLATELKKKKKATCNELKRLDSYTDSMRTWDFLQAIEREAKLWRTANGGIDYLINCNDCLQDKWLPSSEVKDPAKAICHSCQAGVLYGDLLKSRKKKQQKESAAVEEEAA